jgi:hypothetical protein
LLVSATAIEPAAGGSGTLGAIAGAQTTATTPAPRALTRALRAVTEGAKRLPSTPQVLAGVAQVIACAESGTVTVDANGTSATITFNACSDIPGQTLSGSVSVSGITGTPGSNFSATITADVTFTETGVSPIRVAGTFSINEVCSPDCTSTFIGTSLGVGETNETWFLTNFSIHEVLVSGNATINASFTVSSTVLNGAVGVVSTTPLTILAGEFYPSSGVLTITGSANSKARVTILGSNPTIANQVQIEVDADGNGTYETTNNYSWSNLPVSL